MFSSREKDCFLQRKLLHGNFQGRGLEDKKRLFISGVGRGDLYGEWFIRCIPEYTLDLPKQCRTDKCPWLVR